MMHKIPKIVKTIGRYVSIPTVEFIVKRVKIMPNNEERIAKQNHQTDSFPTCNQHKTSTGGHYFAPRCPSTMSLHHQWRS